MDTTDRIAFYHQLLGELDMHDTEENRDTFYMALEFARAALQDENGINQEEFRNEARDNFIDMTNDQRENPILV